MRSHDGVFFDIEREEVIRICELLIAANWADMIPNLLRQGALADVNRLLATETAPAAGSWRASSGKSRWIDADHELAHAVAQRFAAQASGQSRRE